MGNMAPGIHGEEGVTHLGNEGASPLFSFYHTVFPACSGNAVDNCGKKGRSEREWALWIVEHKQKRKKLERRMKDIGKAKKK